MVETGLEKRLLAILIFGEKPKVVQIKTLDCGTEVIKAEVNGRQRYVKIKDLRRKYNETHGEEKFGLWSYQKTDKGYQIEKY